MLTRFLILLAVFMVGIPLGIACLILMACFIVLPLVVDKMFYADYYATNHGTIFGWVFFIWMASVCSAAAIVLQEDR